MFKNNIIYEDNIIVSIVRRVDPYGVTGFFRNPLEPCESGVCPSDVALAPGLRVFEIQCGYMERIDVEEVLKEAGIQEKTIFYGVEEIYTTNPVWHVFSGDQEAHAEPRAVLRPAAEQAARGGDPGRTLTSRSTLRGPVAARPPSCSLRSAPPGGPRFAPPPPLARCRSSVAPSR